MSPATGGAALRDDPAHARRRAAIALLGHGHPAAARVSAAEPAYLLVHDSSDVARQCELLSGQSRAGPVQVVVTPGRGAGEWHIDVAGWDRPGLLAAFTGALVQQGLAVTQAVVATWEDGAALQAFVVRSPAEPDPVDLQRRFARSLGVRWPSPPMPDAEIDFDGEASELYTACSVRAPDRPGLLHAIAAAFAATGVDVHAARVATEGGRAVDHFDLSDGYRHKLAPILREGVRRVVRGGSPGAPVFTGRARAGNLPATKMRESLR